MAEPLERFEDLRRDAYWDVDAMTQPELYAAFAALNDKMNTIYQFVLGYNDYINTRHNYTSEAALTMLEAHLLTDICDHPDCTVTMLAEAWGRSTSATSQTVRRLMAKDLVVRENAPHNGTIYYLRPTEKGVRVSDQHKRYDTGDTIKTIKRLLKTLTFEEIETMFKGIDAYAALLKEGPRTKPQADANDEA